MNQINRIVDSIQYELEKLRTLGIVVSILEKEVYEDKKMNQINRIVNNIQYELEKLRTLGIDVSILEKEV